ncbi:peroxiredoxin Q/BCP [Cyclonatronum proteinivorum]|uniref:thioredoxin-dependent peroxiredoxin n=1 Tax=Cyclonatronum proteinivorum TaxID=1457365 RepID=A0A345UGM8_9BACT|nr:redoxin domain-containing protein [Cyclonatronum proteinivorum]AXI99629.1 peroxiredoxin Q/BCP [Cyclonatronum proteinivorum]
MVAKGDKINTDFTLKVVRGGEEQEVQFSELLDKPAVVSVYMKNNTGSCDKQNKSLAEHAPVFAEKGYNLIALSKDSCGSHKKYADKLGISYILASDPEHAFSSATDSIVEKKMYGKTYQGPSRSAFVIDTDGTVLGVIEKLKPADHAAELIGLIDSL